MRIQAVIGVILAGCAAGAGAADWRFEPRVDLVATSDDNHRMTSNDANKIDVTGAELDALLNIIARTPQSTFRLVPRVTTNYFPDEPDEETTNWFLRSNWQYQGQKSRANADFNYSHRTILGRYFPDGAVPGDGGLGEPDPGTGSGRTTFPTEQDDFLIRPRLIYDFTERTSLVVRMSYQDVTFDDQEFNERVDFTNARGELGLRFRTSPTATLAVIGGASRYEPETGFDSDSQFLGLDWSNDISEVSRIYARGGARRSKTENAVISDWQNGFSGGAGIEWRFEVTDLFFEVNHYLDPSATGQLVTRDQVRGALTRQLTPRSYLQFSGRYVRDEDPGSNDDFELRQFAATRLSYEWRFAREFSMTAGYEYSWRSYEDEADDAKSNMFFAGVSWQPRRPEFRAPNLMPGGRR